LCGLKLVDQGRNHVPQSFVFQTVSHNFSKGVVDALPLNGA
jgi:hypothetical protein